MGPRGRRSFPKLLEGALSSVCADLHLAPRGFGLGKAPAMRLCCWHEPFVRPQQKRPYILNSLAHCWRDCFLLVIPFMAGFCPRGKASISTSSFASWPGSPKHFSGGCEREISLIRKGGEVMECRFVPKRDSVWFQKKQTLSPSQPCLSLTPLILPRAPHPILGVVMRQPPVFLSEV